MIAMHVTPLPGTLTKRGLLWGAVAAVNGQVWRMESRTSAPRALARLLVEHGIADQPVELTSDAIRDGSVQRMPGLIRFPSLHKMARKTIVENAATPIKAAPFVKMVDSSARSGQKQGGMVDPPSYGDPPSQNDKFE